MSDPLISIITPTLNQGPYIEQTVLSVIEQGFQSLEYIVIDAGSTDTTLSILEKFAPRLTWFVKPGLSQSAAINWGWQQAKGSILCWLNSDDLLVPGSLHKVSEFFSSNSETDILYGECNYIVAKGDFIAPYPTEDFDYLDFLGNGVNFIPQPATFIRRKVFESLGGLDEGLDYLMDFDYWLNAGLQFKFAHLRKPLAQLRLHAGAKSVAQLKGFAREIVLIYNRFFARRDLPQEILALRGKGLRNANFIAANISLWAEDFASSRRYGLEGLKLAPLKPSPLLPFYLTGRMGLETLQRFQRNPYLNLQ